MLAPVSRRADRACGPIGGPQKPLRSRAPGARRAAAGLAPHGSAPAYACVSDRELPSWIQHFVDEEVRAGRATSAADVVLEGEMLARAMAWLEDRIYDGLNVDPSDRIDGKRFMLDLTTMASEIDPPEEGG